MAVSCDQSNASCDDCCASEAAASDCAVLADCDSDDDVDAAALASLVTVDAPAAVG